MVQKRVSGVEIIAMDTDKTALPLSGANRQILLSEPDTSGTGTETDIMMGLKAARSSCYEIEAAISGADIVFLVTGLSGGTGTGATPYIAEIARKHKALTIAIVTKPFHFEGRFRALIAAEGIENLTKTADAIIIIDDERLLDLHPELKINEAFNTINETIIDHVSSITGLLTSPGLINLEQANIVSVMQNAGPVWISSQKCTGKNRATDAANEILSQQLSDIQLKSARKILLSFTGGNDLALKEVECAVEIIRKTVGTNADVVFGVIINEQMENTISLTLIASGFGKAAISDRMVKQPVPSYYRREKQIAGVY